MVVEQRCWEWMQQSEWMRGSSGWPYQAAPNHKFLLIYVCHRSSEFIMERSYSEWPFKKAARLLSSSSKLESLKLNGMLVYYLDTCTTLLSHQLISSMFDLILWAFILILNSKGEVCNFFTKWNCFLKWFSKTPTLCFWFIHHSGNERSS